MKCSARRRASIAPSPCWTRSGPTSCGGKPAPNRRRATAYNGRIFNAVATENKPFEIVWDGQVWDLDLWGIPKGSKNKKAAIEFIKYSTDTQRLADQAAWISYGPARASSIPLIGKHAEAGVEMGPQMPTAPDNFKNALQNDFEWWADHQDELNERFAAWLAN
jgi:putative spermidine/putrescine transport system substrate-binding protein